MKCSDIVSFDIDRELAVRLGIQTVFVVGKDLFVFERPVQNGKPQIIMSDDPGVLISGVRSPEVLGIIFAGGNLTKAVLERVVEYKKKVFVPVGRLLSVGMAERGAELGRLRKIVLASRKAGAEVRIITMARSGMEILSGRQLGAVSGLILDGRRDFGLVGDVL